MNSTDLATQFSEYVGAIDPDFIPGTDDVVSKWVGLHIENDRGIEANGTPCMPCPLLCTKHYIDIIWTRCIIYYKALNNRNTLHIFRII